MVGIFGASGSLGRVIASALSAEGGPYRVVGRSRTTLEKEFGSDPLAEIATWTPDDPGSVRSAAEGVETLIYLVGVPYEQFQLHPELMRKTLAGAEAAGVKKLLLIGTLYPFGRPRTERVSEEHPREAHTFKGKMRKEQEDLVLAAQAAGKLQTAVLRLPDFYGPGVDKSFLWSAFQAAKTGKYAQVVGPIDRPHEFVFLPDVGPVVVHLISEPRAWGTTWNLGGVGVTTTKSMVEEIFRQAGRRPRYLVVGKAMLRLAGMFSPLLRELVEMHYLITTPVIVDDTKLKGLLGEVSKTPYKEGVRLTLAALPNP
jgi:nucleoside-diphosphate-sugar epimerase